MDVSIYNVADRRKWDDFIAKSKNGTFLFFRDYMDYHSDRFLDGSLIVYDADKIISLLPANKEGDILISHAGLTYGGFITDEDMTNSKMIRVFDAVISYLAAQGFSKLVYKAVPHIYHSCPAEEDLYSLFLKNAIPYRRDALMVIDYGGRLGFQERRARSIKKALRNELVVKETGDYEQFWEILTSNLLTKYKVKPVHSVDEIKLLVERFPDEIKLFASYARDIMLAGVVVYLSRNVCHAQYIAASEEGKAIGALDIVIGHLIQLYSESKRFFDLGNTTEEDGHYLNAGLSEYKEGFGARAVVHDFYEVTIGG